MDDRRTSTDTDGLECRLSEPQQVVTLPYLPRNPQPEIHKAISENRFSVIVAHRRLGKTVCVINHAIMKALTDKSGSGRYGYVAPYRKVRQNL